MLRLLLITVTMTLVGLGSGYFLWGARVARLTESINSLTLEIDTMRERLARPQATEQPGGIRAVDELRVINESVAAIRTELASQKALLEGNTAAMPPDAAVANAELRGVRNELAVCIADKRDLELRCGSRPAPTPPPSYTQPPVAPQAPAAPTARPPATPSPATPPSSREPIGNDLSDPRF